MDYNRMEKERMLDESLGLLSSEAREILRKYELLHLDKVKSVDDIGLIMCDNPDSVREFENEVLSKFPEKDLIMLRKLLIRNGCYSLSREKGNLYTIVKIKIKINAGTFRPSGYYQAVTEEYTVDRFKGRIQVNYENFARTSINKMNISVKDSKMNTFFLLADKIFYDGVNLKGKTLIDAPRYDVSIECLNKIKINDWGYDDRVDGLIDCIKKILICSI